MPDGENDINQLQLCTTAMNHVSVLPFTWGPVILPAVIFRLPELLDQSALVEVLTAKGKALIKFL